MYFTWKNQDFAVNARAFIKGQIIEDVISQSENLMNNLSEWFIANKLTLSASKSNVVVFRSSGKKTNEIPDHLLIPFLIFNVYSFLHTKKYKNVTISIILLV